MEEWIKEALAEVKEEMAAEDRAVEEAQALPVQPGRCPGSGLRATSSGGYKRIACRVCWSLDLGPWPDDGWPRTPDHERWIT